MPLSALSVSGQFVLAAALFDWCIESHRYITPATPVGVRSAMPFGTTFVRSSASSGGTISNNNGSSVARTSFAHNPAATPHAAKVRLPPPVSEPDPNSQWISAINLLQIIITLQQMLYADLWI